MKKFLCILFSMAVLLTVLPLQSFAEKADNATVEIYGNKISVHAKQICFVNGTEEDSFYNSLYDSGFKKYYYVGDATIDFKVVAQKLPELQNLVVIRSDVKNLSALKNLNDLVWLGLHQCDGTENLSFLKNLTGLEKFRYTSTYCDKVCEDVTPVSKLTNLTELYLDVSASAARDITPLKSLKKLKKLEIRNIGGDDVAVIKNFKNLKELKIKFTSERTDVYFLSSLTKLDSLDLSGNTSNLGATASKYLKNLSKLRIDGNDEDMSFIGELALDELSLSYVKSSFTSSIGKLAGLKYLSLIDINDGRRYDMTFLGELKNLETLLIFGGKHVRLHGNRSIKNLSIMLSEFDDLSGLKNCKELESLVIYNNNDPFNIKWIEGLGLKTLSISDGSFCGIKNMSKLATLKNLEDLKLDFTGIDEKTAKAIKKALPKCRIEVCELSGNYIEPYSKTIY